LFSYSLDDGSKWGFQFPAENFDDAEERLRAIRRTGVVDGQLMGTYSVRLGPWVKFKCWCKNLWLSLSN
jgi:hypothetical protein